MKIHAKVTRADELALKIGFLNRKSVNKTLEEVTHRVGEIAVDYFGFKTNNLKKDLLASVYNIQVEAATKSSMEEYVESQSLKENFTSLSKLNQLRSEYLKTRLDNFAFST